MLFFWGGVWGGEVTLGNNLRYPCLAPEEVLREVIVPCPFGRKIFRALKFGRTRFCANFCLVEIVFNCRRSGCHCGRRRDSGRRRCGGRCRRGGRRHGRLSKVDDLTLPAATDDWQKWMYKRQWRSLSTGGFLLVCHSQLIKLFTTYLVQNKSF